MATALKEATTQHRAISRVEALLLDLIAAESQEIERVNSLIRRLQQAASDHPTDANVKAALSEAEELHAARSRWRDLLRSGIQVLSTARDRAWSLVVLFRKSS